MSHFSLVAILKVEKFPLRPFYKKKIKVLFQVLLLSLLKTEHEKALKRINAKI